jgi:hypothetical protein
LKRWEHLKKENLPQLSCRLCLCSPLNKDHVYAIYRGKPLKLLAILGKSASVFCVWRTSATIPSFSANPLLHLISCCALSIAYPTHGQTSAVLRLTVACRDEKLSQSQAGGAPMTTFSHPMSQHSGHRPHIDPFRERGRAAITSS